jgi:uncharacterized protein
MPSDIEVRDLTTGAVLADRVRVARGWRQRGRGLLGRAGLGAGEGLLLKPCIQVHTWFMRFAIDVLFLDREMTVVGLCRGLSPFRLSPFFWRAAAALELAAGRADGVEAGHRLGLYPPGEDA